MNAQNEQQSIILYSVNDNEFEMVIIHSGNEKLKKIPESRLSLLRASRHQMSAILDYRPVLHFQIIHDHKVFTRNFMPHAYTFIDPILMIPRI